MRRILRSALLLLLMVLMSPTVWAQSITRGPYLQTQTDNSIIVRWRTDVATDSFVRYGTEQSNLNLVSSNGALTTEHTVLVDGLSAATKYFYSIGSSTTPIAGDNTFYFTTSPAQGVAANTRFWVIGDSGTAVTHPGQAAAVRDAFKAYTAQAPADFMIMLGDNAYGSGTDTEYQDAVFDTYPEILRQLPVWSTLGNHDGYSANSNTQSGPYYDIFDFPVSSDANGLNEAGGLSSGTEAYYSWNYGNIHFVNLDSYETDRSIGGNMMTWLEADLAMNNLPWVIAIWHHPPYTKGSHDSDTENELIDMRQNALPILEAWGVDLVMSGHSHSYERSMLIDGHYGTAATLDPVTMVLDPGDGNDEAGGDGAYEKPQAIAAEHEGAVYAVAGSSGKVSGVKSDWPHTTMISYLQVLGSMVIDVNSNRLDAVFIDDSGLVRDRFTILKTPDIEPPLIVDANAEDASHVLVDFSERVDATGATDTANYAIASLAISAAELLVGNRTVRLTTSVMTEGGSYVLTINDVMDEFGNTIAADSQVGFDFFPQMTKSFQDGLAPTPAYDGTNDAYIREASALTNYGADATLQVDGDEPSGSGTDMSIVISWDVSDIPASAMVETATIHLNTLNVGGPYRCFGLLRAWNQSEVTWNAAANASPWATPGAGAASDRDSSELCNINAGSTGPIAVTLNAAGIALVQSWIDGSAANNGIIIADELSSNGADFDSSESASAMNRPRLEVIYTVPVLPPNTPPTADFSFSCTHLNCSFTDNSTDSDGIVTAWSWDFGDGNNSSAQNPVHIFALAGNYTVALTVSDDDSATDFTSTNVTVTVPAVSTLEVMSWVPVYAIPQSQAAAQADFGACDAADGLTRIGLQFWTPNSDGTIKYANHEFYTPVDADVTWWKNWASANGIEVLLTIYNNTGSWDWALARSAFSTNRSTFVNALVAEMDRLGLDGIDLDLEGIDGSIIAGDRADFDQFVHELFTETSSRGKLLTINSFPYIWNAPNQDWWGDWLGEVNNIHSMGYQDLYEAGPGWQKYSYQQATGTAAGFSPEAITMGSPGWLTNWGTSSGRGTSAQAHVQEIRFDIPQPTGIAIWDMQLTGWQNSGLWCEIVSLKGGNPPQLPLAPSDLVAHTWSSARIDLGWTDNASDETGYKLERSPAGSGNWTEVASLAANATNYQDNGLVAGNSYDYRVFTYNAVGESAPSPAATATTFSIPRIVSFSGRDWTVKASGSPVGPGPNYFGDTADDVWVDENGYLHLRITFRDGAWRSSEVVGNDVLGYGNYTFTLGSRVDLLDMNTVVGLFTWDTTAPEFNYREIDIEFTRWGDPQADNSQYVVQPYDTPGNTLRWETTLTGDDSTHAFYWRPDRVDFSSFQGSPPGNEIQTWSYSGADIPPAGSSSGNARINFWLTGGNAPSDGQQAELVIKSFDFTPMPANVAPVASFTYSCTELACDFVDTSSDSDGSITQWQWDFGDGTTSSLQNPSHTYADADSYTVSLTVTDNQGATDASSTNVTVSEPPLFVDYTASGQLPVAGRISGSFADTHTDNDVSQAITERESGGKKQRRYSFLEHKWTFNVAPAAGFTLNLNAWSGGSADGDQFVFSWSTDDVNYTEVLTVNSTDPLNVQSVMLPNSISGSVYIRVQDSDRNAGNRSLDTVYIDQIYIHAENAQGSPPAAPSALDATALSASSIALTWFDNAADELGFELQRSTDQSTWVGLPDAGTDVQNATDTSLLASTTYYYRIRAYNLSGSSAWVGGASATTDDGPPPPDISLNLTGSKSKGRHVIDLDWLGTTTGNVEIYRDSGLLVSVPDSGSYTDNTGNKGGRTYTYQVCEAGTNNCSAIETIVF